MSAEAEQPRKITLEWRGPLRIPNLATSVDRFRPLDVPALYIYRQLYSSICAVYVGRAANFQRRMLQHLEATIGLGYSHRDQEGKWSYNSALEKRLAAFDTIDESIKSAVAHVKLCEFFFAPLAYAETKVVEAALINRLRERDTKSDQPGGMRVECDNTSRSYAGWYEPAVEVDNRAFEGDQGVTEALSLAFGENPIKWGGNQSG